MSYYLLTSIAFTFLLLASAASAAEATTQPAKPRFIQELDAGTARTIVFFGTSLTHHGAYVPQVQAALSAAYPGLVTFHNGAKSGEQSRWGLANVKANVIDRKPDVVFIEFTTNDAVARFNMPVEESRANHEKIIDQILAANPDCQIILQVMNPVIDRPAGHAGHRPDLPAYEQMYRDLAKARGLLLIDHHDAWQATLDQGPAAYKKYVPDGLHPNAAGYEKHTTPTILKTLGVPPLPAK